MKTENAKENVLIKHVFHMQTQRFVNILIDLSSSIYLFPFLYILLEFIFITVFKLMLTC